MHICWQVTDSLLMQFNVRDSATENRTLCASAVIVCRGLLLLMFIQLLLYCCGIKLNNAASAHVMHSLMVLSREREDNCASAWVITPIKPAEFAAPARSAASTKPRRIRAGVFLRLLAIR